MRKNKNIFTLIHIQILKIITFLKDLYHNSFIKEYLDKSIAFIRRTFIYESIIKFIRFVSKLLMKIPFIRKGYEKYYLYVHEYNTVDNRAKKIFTVFILAGMFAFITFIQPKTVTIIVDGQVMKYATSYPLASTVAQQFTEDNNINDYSIHAGGGNFIGPSEVIEIKILKTITINYQNESINVDTYAVTLDELYQEQSPRLVNYDKNASFYSVDYPNSKDTYLRDLNTVKVSIKTTKVETKEVTTKAGTEYQKDANLESGNRELITKGVDDIRTVENTTTYLDGKQYAVDTKVVSIKQQGQNTIYRLGTKPAAATATNWDRLAKCESGGNWARNSGNGFYGGLQFHPQTWNSVSKKVGLGHIPYAHLATKEEQIKVASYLQKKSGWGQWPACAKKLGLLTK